MAIVWQSIGSGKVVVTKKGMNFRTYSLDWRENEAKKSFIRMADPLRDIVKSTVHNYWPNLKAEAKYALLFAGLPLVVLAFMGVRKPLLFSLPMFLIFPVFTGMGMPQRFVLPYMPFLIVFAGVAVARFRLPQATWLLVIAGMGFGADFVFDQQDNFFELRQAGVELSRYRDTVDAKFMDRKPYTAFYSGIRRADQFYSIPHESPEKVVEYAKQLGIDYLVLSRRIVGIFRPQLEIMFENNFGLRKVLSVYPNTPYEVLIYEIPHS
jgi:hypothetical protein